MSMNDKSRQVRKTRAAILDAFRDLVLDIPYADLRVADVIARADVGRSTFYDHFRNKDDLLRESLSGIVLILAGTVNEECDVQHLEMILEHFRENQQFARIMLNGPPFPVMLGALAAQIEKTVQENSEATTVLPMSLICEQIAGCHFGLIRAWLYQGCTTPAADVAHALHQSGTTLRHALIQG